MKGIISIDDTIKSTNNPTILIIVIYSQAKMFYCKRRLTLKKRKCQLITKSLNNEF